MKILIITQVVDKTHPILGFFHRWIEEFASQVDQVHVIALQVGEYNLPKNVTVHSLGKDEGKGRVTYVLRFFSLIWSLRKEYDTVFVHMNQIYVLLGSFLWKLTGKKVGLWYAHGTVTKSLQSAVLLSDVVFTSTPEGLQIDTDKKKIVGQGIDTGIFSAPLQPNKSQIVQLVTVGRISPSKNIETLLRACVLLRDQGFQYHFTVIGVPTTKEEEQYAERMYARTKELNLSEFVTWHGAVVNEQLPALLQVSDVFIHDGATNSLDKVLIEASLCGCVVLSTNPAYCGATDTLAPELLYKVGDAEKLAELIAQARSFEVEANKVRVYFKDTYSVSHLISNIINQF